MRATLIATFLAASAAPLLATAAAADTRATQDPRSATSDAPSAAHESPLIAHALELAGTESRSRDKWLYNATTNVRAIDFEMSRHPPPSDEECAHTLGANRFADQYVRLASFQEQLGDFEAVMAANESARACEPRVASHEAAIASTHLRLGHIDEARAAIERGHALDAEDRSVRNVRARLDFIQERWADATARFRLQALDASIGNERRAHARCYLWLAQRRAGMLNPDMPPVPQDTKDADVPRYKEWPARILETLRGEQSEEALLRALREGGVVYEAEVEVGDERGPLTEALFYLGELKLAEGDPEMARRYFASVINLKVLDYVEYGMARAELKKMRDRNAVADAATAGTQAR